MCEQVVNSLWQRDHFSARDEALASTSTSSVIAQKYSPDLSCWNVAMIGSDCRK